MKNLLGALLLTGSALLTTSAALAQDAPDLPAGKPAPAQSEASAALARKSKPAPKQLTPEQEEQEKQIRLLEARTGNTSYSAGSGSIFRQTDKGDGAFTLRKYKSMAGQEEKRGVSKRPVLGGTTHGEPLKYGQRKKNFFSF